MQGESTVTFDFHPAAAGRFDELALDILRSVQVTPGIPQHAPNGFVPEIHPVGSISKENIVGPVRMTQSVVDGTGTEVGRIFKGEGGVFQVTGLAYEKLVDLTGRLLKSNSLEEVASRQFVFEAIFSWLQEACSHGVTNDLCVYIRQRVNAEVKDHEVWIPLYRVHIEREIQLGEVRFRTISKQMIDGWHKIPNHLTAEQKTIIVQVLNRERSSLQACAAATAAVRAEQQRALELARLKAEAAISFLRFLSPANFTPKLRSHCMPLGQENIQRTYELLMRDETIQQIVKGAIEQGPSHWIITQEYLSQMPGVIEHLHDLASTRSTDFRRALYDALLRYSRNTIASDPADKLVHILVSLESMLLRNDGEPISKNLSERMAFLIGDSLENRKTIVANVQEIYRLRSSFIHHGNSIDDLETLSVFMTNAWACFHNLLGYIQSVKSKDELINLLEDRKMT